MLLRSPESIKLMDIQKLLPKAKEELFSKRMRYYNLIILNSNDKSEFTINFTNEVQSI